MNSLSGCPCHMIRHRLALSAMNNQVIVFIFVTALTFDYVWMIKNTGTYYKAVYISNTKQEEEQQILHHLQKYLHRCSINLYCNYVVEDKENGVKMFNTRSETTAEEELLGIWMKMRRQYHYKIYEKELNWHDARETCQLYGGDLASITSKEEEEMIKKQLSVFASNRSFYFGLNDIEEEGKHVWSDGSDYSYKNWEPGEPNSYGNEDCMITKPKLTWHDVSCATKFFFVCKNIVH